MRAPFILTFQTVNKDHLSSMFSTQAVTAAFPCITAADVVLEVEIPFRLFPYLILALRITELRTTWRRFILSTVNFRFSDSTVHFAFTFDKNEC